MPQVAYAISSGEYSDYGVHVFFLDRALAEAHLAQLQVSEYSHYGIEEFPLLTEPPTRRRIWAFRMMWHEASGTVTSEETSVDLWDYQPDLDYLDRIDSADCAPWYGGARPTKRRTADGGYVPTGLVVSARSEDRERAIKLASDRMAMERARAMGL